jgi:hypothetical protein
MNLQAHDAERREIAKETVKKLQELNQRKKSVEEEASKLMQAQKMTTLEQFGLQGLLTKMRSGFQEAQDRPADGATEVGLKEATERLQECENELTQLRRRFEETGVSPCDTRILKLCSESGAHILPLPISYEALMESVERFYGAPESGYGYVVSWKEFHIVTNYELRFVYSKFFD